LGDYIQTEAVIESAILVAVELKQQNEVKTKEYLDELAFLARTAGAEVKKAFVQRLEYPNPKTYVGTGKLADIVTYAQENDIDMAIFDDELSPSQIRNLESELKIKIIDRSALILDIFARNARTAQSRAQVELAQSQYLLPRLTRLWTHLEKQRGGIGMKGPGEKEIETDRRVIRDKIALLKKKLQDIDKQNVVQRKNRTGKMRVSLVGYTNVGKSTLMNLLSKADVLAENKLFATLDATTRKVVWHHPDVSKPPIEFLLSDTVGFIRKLPHQLIESFKSTLDEVVESDLLLHVVDVSHPGFEEQILVVNETLQEIGAGNKPVIMVFNKIDQYAPEATHEDIFEDQAIYSIEDLKKSWMAKEHMPVVFISASEKLNTDDVKDEILRFLVKSQTTY
jgi:GTP-binding protein HflX